MSSQRKANANDPDSRHIDDSRILTDLHDKSPGKPCFWKHDDGTSSAECIRIPTSEYDTHPCHYRANGIKRAESEPHVYNTRRIPGMKPEKPRANNREVAQMLGFLVKDNTSSTLTPNRTTGEYTTLAEDVAAHKNRSEPGKGTRFLEAYRARYGKSLGWLAKDPQAWDVKYRIPLDSKEFKQVYGASKTNVATDYEGTVRKIVAPLTNIAPVNFHIQETNIPANKGLGKWYPYEHDHHHMIPASAFQEYVLNAPSDNPSDVNYMSRARVVMQGSWNIHDQVNMIMLPNEIYPARILDLAAHIPWQMGADHPTYSKSLEKSLEPIRKILDDVLKNPTDDPHEAEKQASADFTKEMTELCNEQRDDFLDKGFFVLEPK
ncbi:MAG TPA: hypothetical protein VLQ93_14865 [Myxococcaceae bacterium]|nr:hypothetical protein [Myxococcaceae bacterium]